MPQKKVYGYYENNCKVEVLTKKDAETKLNEKQNKVLFGTTPPTNDMGVDGDIYIQIEA